MAIDTRAESSHLGKSFRFQGDISGTEDIYIDGEVEGTIQMPGQMVTVGPHANVSAEIEARELIIHGKLKGNANAHDRIELAHTGHVVGDLCMSRISIQAGAVMQGRVDVRTSASATAPAIAAAAPAAAVATAAASTGWTTPAAPGEPQQASLLDRKF